MFKIVDAHNASEYPERFPNMQSAQEAVERMLTDYYKVAGRQNDYTPFAIAEADSEYKFNEISNRFEWAGGLF